MQHDLAMKWVKDLRSPGIRQAKSVLFDGYGYCCLGRLCIVLGHLPNENFDEEDEGLGEAHYDFMGVNEVLPEYIQKEAAISAEGKPSIGKVEIEGEEFGSLADANDKGCTFAQIADWIEANYERL